MNDELTPVRVWDLPTRVFHWLLASCVIASIVSAQIGGNALVWHFRLGYVVFTLLAFRILWGLVGGHWSRFASFVYAPATVARYVRGERRAGEHVDVGHNPLGDVVRKKHDLLLRPMIVGDKPLTADVPASLDNRRTRALALVLVVLCAGLVTWIVSLGD